MARYNGLSEKDQDEVIQKLRFILRNKFKFPFDIRRMINQGGRELYIYSEDKELEKMKMFFCHDLDFDPDSILGHSGSRYDLAIRIDTLRQGLIDSIESEYKRIIGNHKDLEIGHHLLETNGKVIPLSTNEIIPVPIIEYKSIIPNPRFVKVANNEESILPDVKEIKDEEIVSKKVKIFELSAKLKNLHPNLLKEKFRIQILKTEKMENEKDSNEQTAPVKKKYTGAKRGPKSRAEKEALLASTQSEVSTEPLDKVPKTPKVTKEKLPKVPKVKKERVDKKAKLDQEKLIDAYKFKVLGFLNSVIKAENQISSFTGELTRKNRFCYFHKDSDGPKHFIVCRNDAVTSVAYKALAHVLDKRNNPDAVFIVRDAPMAYTGYICINFDMMDKWKKEKYGIRYCIPPKRGATRIEVMKRLTQVFDAPFQVVTHDGLFSVSYEDKDIMKKIFSIISEMNWPVSEIRENDFIIDLHPESQKIKSETKRQEPVLERVVTVAISSVKEPLTFDQKIKALFKDEEEAMSEFENIFFDAEAFAKLSPEMVLKIAAALKDWYRRNDPQKYAEFLFKILGK